MNPFTSSAAHAIIMIGIPGAGKSTFAEHFAKTFQSPILNLRQISHEVGIDEASSARVIDLLLDELLKTKRTIILEGQTSNKADRISIARKLSSAGYEPLFVWVQTESTEAHRRATKRRDGQAISDDEFVEAVKRFSPPTATEKVVVISGKHTYSSQLKIVLKRIAGDKQVADIEQPRTRSSRNIILR